MTQLQNARSHDGIAAATSAPDPVGGLSVSGVSKTFPDGTVALTETSFTVPLGQFTAIVGPSGCGKSTLLRIASGLTRPTTGTVDTGGLPIGYVFQDPTLLPWRTVLRNVELLAELAGVDRAERRERALAAIALTGLTGFEKHRPRALSGGMRMRVSLARALTLRPRIFLFDEPFGALDEITRERLGDELLNLFVTEGFAGLFVTHSISEAVYLASRVLVMSPRPGRVVADIAVPFEYPRHPELRFDPQFGEIAAAVSAALRSHSQAGEQ